MRVARLAASSLMVVFCASLLAAEDAPELSVDVQLSPREATIGDPLDLTLTVTLPPDARLLPQPFGPQLGSFSVLEGEWEMPGEDGPGQRVWRGKVAAYETGNLELPGLVVRVESEGETTSARSPSLQVTIVSVLPPDGTGSEPLEIAELKGPASMKAQHRALWIAGLILLVVLLISLLAWWLARRYGDRLAARPVPQDLFHRVPPHVWIYGELKRLLESRLADQGEIEQFFTELSWILKHYLSGRYRLELMERTTSELAPLLREAGAPAGPSRQACSLLERSDLVKFARQIPRPEECRAAVEQTYRIVDATRVTDEPERVPGKGAA